MKNNKPTNYNHSRTYIKYTSLVFNINHLSTVHLLLTRLKTTNKTYITKVLDTLSHLIKNGKKVMSISENSFLPGEKTISGIMTTLHEVHPENVMPVQTVIKANSSYF